jgi:hypothetical protein
MGGKFFKNKYKMLQKHCMKNKVKETYFLLNLVINIIPNLNIITNKLLNSTKAQQ